MPGPPKAHAAGGLMSFRDDRDAERIEELFGRYVDQLLLDGAAPDPALLLEGD